MTAALPKAFTDRMSRQLNSGLPDFLRAMDEKPLRGIRMNLLKPFEGMGDYTANEQVPWAEGGYYLDPESRAGATVFHEAGAFYLQEPSAMLPGEVMDAHPGEKILDLCAAPGGKATQMGLKMKGEGLLICNEPMPKRAMILSRNVERMGIPNSVVTSVFPDRIPHSWDNLFDGVLADAPCSGEGMFRRDPQTRLEWSPEKADGCAKRQKEILREASRLVRPGGRLVYATCTYNSRENREVVDWFLKEHPEFHLEPFSLPGAEGKDGTLLCLPSEMKGEGQYVAKLRREGTEGEKASLRLRVPFPPADQQEAGLLMEAVPGVPAPNSRFGNLMMLAPECPDLRGIRVMRAGLVIAEMRGKNPVPDHAAAVSIFNRGVAEKQLEAGQAARYIAGEEIGGEEKGWILMTFRGLVLGWGKGSGGTIKNHYPKGLRKEQILTETG